MEFKEVEFNEAYGNKLRSLGYEEFIKSYKSHPMILKLIWNNIERLKNVLIKHEDIIKQNEECSKATLDDFVMHSLMTSEFVSDTFGYKELLPTSSFMWGKKLDEETIDEYFERNKIYRVPVAEIFREVSILARNLDYHLSFKDRSKDIDIKEDGHPRLGAGNICRAFIPVKDLKKELPIGEELTLETNRGRKEKKFKIVYVYPNEAAYKVQNMDTLEYVYIMNHSDIASAYNTLFPINKVLFGGWWNKTLNFKY